MAGHQTESEAERCKKKKKWQEHVVSLSSALWPALLSLSLSLGYLGDHTS